MRFRLQRHWLWQQKNSFGSVIWDTRAKYVLDTARKVCFGDISLNSLHDMTYKAARKELLGLYGVGEKVADCICLFGLHQLDAFPVDTHIRQALDAHYKRGFPNRRYKSCRGVMQQYIFYYELMKVTIQQITME